MIEYTKGNILEAGTEAIVNPVNRVGVMGGGLAKQFKEVYPEMYEDYRDRCKEGLMEEYQCHVFTRFGQNTPHYIINFPTKFHWKEQSELRAIDITLLNLITVIKQYEIRSIAVPALGCGLGGLLWRDIKDIMEKRLSDPVLEEEQIIIYEPM